jgi:asparagine synthase (glutamine-hydrolysing)
MCGLAATYGYVDRAAGERMLERLAHRGPDDTGSVTVSDRAWLGHTRLSIVDVEGGQQPLSTEEPEMWLVGNGEIYNHEDVRQTFDGRIFSTRSDNEVALHLISERGVGAIDELSGMYAFLAASTDGRFIAARDPVGIKPLYWARRGDDIRFASEMRAFDADWLPLVEFFPPGHCWTPDEGLVRFERAVPASSLKRYPGPDSPDAPMPDDMLRETREVLVSAVDRQMMGDVDVGVFLSGGLDSSLVAAIAADYLRARGKRLQTFAVGTEHSGDLLAARAVAAEHVKVVLTGEGADEIFAGYPYLHSDFPEPGDLHDELVRTIEGLHNLNLQRTDRVSMAHGLEARVPFLDREVIAFGLHLPAGWKVAGPDHPEKRLLREAFDGWLPEELLWRTKEEFGTGSGAQEVLSDAVEARITDEELAAERDELDPPIRSKEELAYYRILKRALPGLSADDAIGRFATS